MQTMARRERMVDVRAAVEARRGDLITAGTHTRGVDGLARRSQGASHERRERLGLLVPAVTAMVVIAAAGCGGGAGRVSLPASPRPRHPVVVTAPPAATATVASRLIARVRVANPDGLVEVGGSVWVKTDDGRVVRIDPSSDTVTGSVRIDTARAPNHYCQGIGTDGVAVWACTASDTSTGIVRIDPRTMSVGTPIAVGKLFDQLSLPYTSRGLWVLTGSGETVAVVDTATGALTTYHLGARCQPLAVAETIVVATCANDDRVVALNPVTGKVIARVSLSAPRIAAVWGHDVWVDTSRGLTRLGTNLTVEALYPNQVIGLEGDLAVTKDAVWVRGPGGVLWRIDPRRNMVAERLTPAQPVSAGSLLVTTHAIWASENNEGIVIRLRR